MYFSGPLVLITPLPPALQNLHLPRRLELTGALLTVSVGAWQNNIISLQVLLRPKNHPHVLPSSCMHYPIRTYDAPRDRASPQRAPNCERDAERRLVHAPCGPFIPACRPLQLHLWCLCLSARSTPTPTSTHPNLRAAHARGTW